MEIPECFRCLHPCNCATQVRQAVSPQVAAIDLGSRQCILKGRSAAVGDWSSGCKQHSKIGQALQVYQAGIGRRGLSNVQFLKSGQAHQMREPCIGDVRLHEGQRLQTVHSFQVREAGIRCPEPPQR